MNLTSGPPSAAISQMLVGYRQNNRRVSKVKFVSNEP